MNLLLTGQAYRAGDGLGRSLQGLGETIARAV